MNRDLKFTEESDMEEKYYLPVLFTEEERKRYAEWGIKKEKVLVPFALITILIDLFVLIGTGVYLFAVREQEPYFTIYLSIWGPFITEFAYGIAILLTVLIIKPLDLILDKIFKKPQEAKMLYLTPKVQGVCYVLCQGRNTLSEGILDWFEWKNAITLETNEICIKGMILRIGANTIESIYPKGKQNPWMDRPEEKIRNSVKLKTISRNFEGYLASLEEQKKEEDWIRQFNRMYKG